VAATLILKLPPGLSLGLLCYLHLLVLYSSGDLSQRGLQGLGVFLQKRFNFCLDLWALSLVNHVSNFKAKLLLDLASNVT